MDTPSVLPTPSAPKVRLTREEARRRVFRLMSTQTGRLSTALLLAEVRYGWRYVQKPAPATTAIENIERFIKEKRTLLAKLEETLREEEKDAKENVHKHTHPADVFLVPTSTRAHIAKLTREIKLAEAALRVRKGEHPFDCVDCGEVIPRKRLKANPLAIRCKDCAEVTEKFHK